MRDYYKMKSVLTENAPQAIGPYSQAIISDKFIFCSGCIPLDPTTMTVHAVGIEEQTSQVLKNMTAILEAAGSGLKNVVKTTVFLKDMADFQKMNVVYARFFDTNKPARSTVQVACLPLDVLVEIECIATI